MTKVYLSEDEIREFKAEAEEFIDHAETAFLAIDKGDDFTKNYELIIRAFHTIKGAATMLDWEDLRLHVQTLEKYFLDCKTWNSLSEAQVSYFLEGLDVARKILSHQPMDYSFEALARELSDVKAQTPASASVPEMPQRRSLLAKERVEKSTIIVLDDEYENVDILTDILTLANYEVFGFTNPQEALKAVVVKKPHAFFSDMSMPMMNGVDVLRAVQKLDIDLPVIFVSAFLSKEILIDSISLGVFAAIEKPFREEQILTVTRNACRKYQLWLLLNRSINLVMYQFAAIDQSLQEKGLAEVRDMMKREMQSLLDVRRELREGKP